MPWALAILAEELFERPPSEAEFLDRINTVLVKFVINWLKPVALDELGADKLFERRAGKVFTG
ncbi:MAG: hypothetical protein N2116_02670 [Armatimonadetes bacterium]|nr:hypothetical protein [Armatimonadota bacterium]